MAMAGMHIDPRMDHSSPARGFPKTEFERRLAGFQRCMANNHLDAVLLTTEPNVRYFSGFLTQFWQSPTRPWFLVLPLDGEPIAIIPEIGVSGMQDTWVSDIRSWPSPRPEDDGISLLIECLSSLCRRYRRLGMTLGPESHLRMPANNVQALKNGLAQVDLVDVSEDIHNYRMVKSELEIEKARYICDVASRGFENVASWAQIGMSEMEICRQFKMDLLNLGIDQPNYMVAGSGNRGYTSIIMGPGDRTVGAGDVLIIDTGSTFDGYFCDFDRNWAFGSVDDATRSAYRTVWQATEAGFNTVRPGATTTDLWRAMNDVMVDGGSEGNDVGRLGHGLGIELTERPSNTHDDFTRLEPGMIMTLEPGMTYGGGKQMVHEENVLITEDGAEWLTRRAPEEIPVIK
ncbi:MAG: Xaa-Pro peptidase family protein [Pseudomonadota bacterium]